MVGEVYLVYEREIRRMNAMDFDDLLMRLVQLLEQEEDVRTRYANGVPARPRRRVPGHQPRAVPPAPAADGRRARARNLAVVGDDAQSIYGFRGADVRNILDFERDFPEAEVVKLEQNYRSTETILQVANAVIANNRGGIKRSSGAISAPATPCSCANSPMSTPRRATSSARPSV